MKIKLKKQQSIRINRTQKFYLRLVPNINSGLLGINRFCFRVLTFKVSILYFMKTLRKLLLSDFG